MRIECDSCGAKYSIGDEKVAGRMLKVRCKKCGNMIRVDGTTLGASDETTRVFDVNAAQSAAEASMADADGSIWFVVVDGQQTGPLLVSEVEAYLASGEVDAETYAWRDGLDDWQRIADIPELARLLGGGAADDEGDDGGFSDEATRVVSLESSEPRQELPFGGLARAASATVERFPSASYHSIPAPTPQSSARGMAPIGGISGGAAGASISGGTGAGADLSASGGDKLLGQRNESSVLFSLSDLTSGSKSKKADDLPRTEGSGLIDIRMLAGNTTAMKPVEPSFGGAAPAATQQIAVAPLLPVPARRTSTGLVVGISLGAVAIIALTVALVVILLKEPQVPVAAGPVAPAAPTAAVAAPTAPPAVPTTVVAAVVPTTPPPAVPTTEGSGAAVPPAVPTTDVAAAVPTTAVAAVEQTDAERERERERERDSERENTTATNTTTTTTTTETRPPTTPTERDPDAVANAIASIRQERGGDEQPATTTTTTAEPAPSEASTLDRDTIRATVRRYGSRIAACRPSDGTEVRFTVSWVIQPSGSVTNVSPSDSTDVAQCVGGVIGDISFPRFDGEAIPVRGFPFNL
jgi:predicted Zn finger-like uncharacterized protein